MYLNELKVLFTEALSTDYPTTEIETFYHRSIADKMGLKRVDIALNPERQLTTDEKFYFEGVIERLQKKEPLQYVLGHTEFYGLPFKLSPEVLIPRPETEELVAWIVQDFKDQPAQTRPSVSTNKNPQIVDLSTNLPQGPNDGLKGSINQYFASDLKTYSAKVPADKPETQNVKLLDIGAGSGCIAIALAKNITDVEVMALDVSPQALEVARKNAFLNQVDIHFIHADILNFKETIEPLDVIVSNPPYVREQEKKEIKPNVLAYEPALALFVPDDDALKFYQAIGHFALTHLKPRGALYFEINQYLAQETKDLISGIGFVEVQWRKDLYGNPRMLKAIKP